MKVEAILTAKGREVETTPPDADLQLVLHKLANLGIGCLVVSTDGRRVDGVISERDVVRAVSKHGQRFHELRVRDVMSRSSPTCSPDDTLPHVMEVMTRTRHRHMPVIDADGVLCGIVSVGDIVKNRLDEMELERNVLRDAYIARH